MEGNQENTKNVAAVLATPRQLEYPEIMPTREELDGLNERKEKKGFQAVLWKNPPKPEIDRAIHEIGMKNLVSSSSSCDLLSKGETHNRTDYLAVMKKNIENLRQDLQ